MITFALFSAEVAAGEVAIFDDFAVASPAGNKVQGRRAVSGQTWLVSANPAVVDTIRGAATHPGGAGGGYAFIDIPGLPTHFKVTFEFDSSQSSFVLAAGMIGITDFLHPQVGPNGVNWLASIKGVGTLVNIFGNGGYWTWPEIAPKVRLTFEYWLNHGGDPKAMRVRDPTGAERTLYSEHLPALMAGARGLTIQPTTTTTFIRTVEAGSPLPPEPRLVSPSNLRILP
jgi:hypothetical protein